MNILLVEDDTRVADFVRRGLKAEGHNVDHSPDGETALGLLRSESFDVVILDLMLPGISGTEVCRRMRARGNLTPLLMLTALDALDDRVAGLRAGADDYLSKPFDFEELLARLEAMHRRSSKFREGGNDGILIHAGLKFDSKSQHFLVDDVIVGLSVKERDLAVLLLSNVGRALSRERILNTVWGTQSNPLTNIVDVYIGKLRKRFGPYGAQITTVRGSGYRLD